MSNSEHPEARQHEKKDESGVDRRESKSNRFSEKIIWSYLIYLVFVHVGFVAALASYMLGFHSVPTKRLTVYWGFFSGVSSSLGITAGAHRLWTHRSFKARRSLKILLMILYCGTGMYGLRTWINDHRQHHKYTDTDLDPHNSRRGLVYSHWGWLVIKRTPECIRAGKEIDMDDIRADPVVMFQSKHKLKLLALFTFFLPTVIPIIFLGETVLHAVLIQCFIRYGVMLNVVLCINSLAHYWGYRPYKKSASATENLLLSIMANGEGMHNYHHTFPWDYKATEIPYINFNGTALFIRAMASLGLAYDLKEPSIELVEEVKKRNCDENPMYNMYNDL